MNLEVAIAHMTYTDIAEAFQKVTGTRPDTSTPISTRIGTAHSKGLPICLPGTTPTPTTRAP